MTELCERMAFYGFQGSLVLYFTKELKYASGDADMQTSLWNGVCYITPLLGGWIADSYTGRYTAIMIFINIYLVGMIMVSITAVPNLR